jgi:hypothetical protein
MRGVFTQSVSHKPHSIDRVEPETLATCGERWFSLPNRRKGVANCQGEPVVARSRANAQRV